VHLYKYWSLAGYPSTVGKCDTLHLPVFIVLPSGDFFTLPQVTCVCVCMCVCACCACACARVCVDSRYYSERELAKHTIRWNDVTMTKQNHLANALADECFPHKPILGTVWQLFAGFLVHCAIIGAFLKYASRSIVPFMVSPGFFCQTQGRPLKILI